MPTLSARDDIKYVTEVSQTLRLSGCPNASSWVQIISSMNNSPLRLLIGSQANPAMMPFGVSPLREGEVDRGQYSINVAVKNELEMGILDVVQATIIASRKAESGLLFIPSWKRAQMAGHHNLLRVKISPQTKIRLWISADGSCEKMQEHAANVATIVERDKCMISADLRGLWSNTPNWGASIHATEIIIIRGIVDKLHGKMHVEHYENATKHCFLDVLGKCE